MSRHASISIARSSNCHNRLGCVNNVTGRNHHLPNAPMAESHRTSLDFSRLPRPLRACAFALVLWCPLHNAIAATNELPDLGDGAAALVSPAQERELGEKLIRQLRKEAPTNDDPALKYFCAQLLAELAAASELTDHNLHPVLIESPVLNAFAAPGGVVGINLGLFLHADNVHQLSAVLAHELAHLSQRHYARTVEYQKQSAVPYIAALLASVALMAVSGGSAGIAALSATQAAAQDSALRYSRAREQEADHIGIETLVRAGFDPHAMASMFEQMSYAARFDRKLPEFLLTHPVTENRIADARNRAAAWPARPYPDRVEFEFVQARVRVMYAKSADQAVAMFAQERNNVRLIPSAADYGYVYALSRANRHDEALRALRIFTARAPDNLFVHLLEAEVKIQAGRPRDALPLLERQLRLNPGNAPLSMYYAQALTGAHRYAEAEQVLLGQSHAHPEDTDVWEQLAETAGLAHDIVNVHSARAEYFQLHGDFDKALEHLKYASRLVDQSNFQLSSKLAQRSIDMRAMRKRLG